MCVEILATLIISFISTGFGILCVLESRGVCLTTLHAPATTVGGSTSRTILWTWTPSDCCARTRVFYNAKLDLTFYFTTDAYYKATHGILAARHWGQDV